MKDNTGFYVWTETTMKAQKVIRGVKGSLCHRRGSTCKRQKHRISR